MIALACAHCGHTFTMPTLARLTRCPACDEMTRGDTPAGLPSGHQNLYEARLNRRRRLHHQATEAWDAGDTGRALALEQEARYA